MPLVMLEWCADKDVEDGKCSLEGWMNTPAFVCDRCGVVIDQPHDGCLAYSHDRRGEPTLSWTGVGTFSNRGRMPTMLVWCFHWKCYDIVNEQNEYRIMHQTIGESARYLAANMEDAYKANRESDSSSPKSWHEYHQNHGIPIGRRPRPSLSKSDREEIMMKSGGACHYCKESLGPGWHVDHVVPISRGGTNGRHNLVAACANCNMLKRDATAEEFAEMVGVDSW